MKLSLRITSTLLLALSFAALAVAAPKGKTAPAPSVAGTWNCVSHGGQNGGMPFTLDLQQQGETVTGSVSSPMGGTDLTSASYKDGTLQIEIDTQDQPYILMGKLENGHLKGKWSHGQASGAWEGTKATASSKSSSDSQ